MKLTGWYSGDQKPVRVGVYERDYSVLGLRTPFVYCYWDGKYWHLDAPTPLQAKNFSWGVSKYQFQPWRGVAK